MLEESDKVTVEGKEKSKEKSKEEMKHKVVTLKHVLKAKTLFDN